ncbi:MULTISPECIES: hypothetical protein [Rhodomicrobium]|uniref:hypothetical protein n=1 Tax=Rhodomicrobium TaxID=1068 RepID=UPI001482DA7B|nr:MULTISPECIES: hypothetical protein [Rhodomicrobium]
MIKGDADNNETLSKQEIDDLGEEANGEWSLAEGQDSTKLVEDYGGSDGELSLDEIAQAYLGGVIITPGTGTVNRLRLGNGSFNPPIMIAAVEGGDNVPGIDERETRILKAAYGTNGELSDEQLQKAVDDGVIVRDGDKYKDINLGKMPAENKARAFFTGDKNGDGLMTAEEFHDGMDYIFSKHARLKSLSLDDARTLVDAYGKDGLINAEQVKKAMDDGSFIVEGGRSPLRSGFSPDKKTLYGTVNFKNLPAKQNAYMSKDEDHSGGLNVKELGAFFDERQARLLIAAYGEKGEVNEDQIKKMLEDGIIYRDGESLKNFNLGKLPDDRLAKTFFAFDDNHDGTINAEELDKATDAIFLDNKLVDAQQARVLVSAYGKDGLLNLDQMGSIIKDGVITAKDATTRLRSGTTPDRERLEGTLALAKMPTEKLPGALMAYDGNHDGRLNAEELDNATDGISQGDEKLLTRDQAQMIVTAMADDGKSLTAEEVKAIADSKILTTSNGKLAFDANRISDYLFANPDTPTPWSEDYFKYIGDEKLPGQQGTISDLSFQKLLEQYKDAPKDSKQRKFYDLILAKHLTTQGWSNPDHFDAPISGDEFSQNVLDKTKVDEELTKLLKDGDFTKTMSEDLAKKTNEVIAENFVMIDGKITLFDKNNEAHKNAPRASGTGWAKAALAYTRSEEGRKEYRTGTPEEQKAFIEKYFGALGGLLPPEDVQSALGELGVATAVDAIANTDLKDISDENLASSLQVVGQYLMKARGPLNLIGNLSNMTREDWLSLARAFKLAGATDKLDFKSVMDKLTDGNAKNFVKAMGATGMWGTFAGSAGIAGAILTYASDGPARDRLLAGDPREVLGLMQNISLVLSYSTSMIKAPTAAIGKLLKAVGYNGVEDFYKDFKDLPGFSGLVQYSSQFQPSFSAVADALNGVDLKDKAAVTEALKKVKADSLRLWNDIGYDFDKLADRIVEHARTFDTTAVYGDKVPNTTVFSNEERLGFLYDMTGVDDSYKDFVRANQILDLKDPKGKAPDVAVTDEASLRTRLRAGGMSEEAINRVVGDLDLLSRDGAPQATGERKLMLDRFKDSKFISSPSGASAAQTLVEGSVEKFLNSSPDAKLAPVKLERAGAGLFVKSLGAAMDVIGGALGIATGIMDVVSGAGSGDKLKIASGSFGIASGILGGLGGLAGFGALGSIAAGPLFIVAGVFGVVSLILTLVNGDKHESDQFADSILDRFTDDGVVKDGAHDYLKTWWLNHTTDYEDSGIAS